MEINDVTSISEAARAYAETKTQNASPIKQGEAFQSVMKAELNRYAGMTPDQILSAITAIKHANAVEDSIKISSSVGSLSSALRENEGTIKRLITKDASLTDVLKASTEASNTLKTATKIRDLLQTALDKVFNMQI